MRLPSFDRRCRRAPPVVALGFALSACGPDFPPASEVDGLRVFAVEKSAPYARPGDRVDLELLWHDTGPLPGSSSARPAVPQIAWLATCENPPGDLFEACFTQVPEASELEARLSLPEAGASSANARFSVSLSRDIISSRPPPPSANTTPYGLQYVFFAVCAGTLGLRMDLDLPFVCYDERDGEPGFGAGDLQLGSRDFVVGYTAIYAYEELANTNPIVYGLEFDGVRLLAEGGPPAPAEVANGARVLPASDLCVGSACLDAPPTDAPCDDPLLTLDACGEDCEEIGLRPLVDPASAELDEAATRRGSEVLQEQMWINYYATRGEMSDEVRLLNDAVTGWNTSFDVDYRPPEVAGTSYVWAVAHDNRGGTEWLRLRLCSR